MSASWKQKKGRSRTRKSSKAASALIFEWGRGRQEDGGAAEGGRAVHGEGVPVGNGKAEVVFEGLAHHDLVGVVELVGKGIGAVGTFVLDDGKLAEEGVRHGCLCLLLGSLGWTRR